MRNALLALLFLSAAAITPAWAVSLVVNGGFETGDFTGWTQSGDVSFTGVGPNAYSGFYGAYFGPVQGMGYITQTLATTAGGVYDLSFFLGNGDYFHNNAFEVWWDGTSLGSLVNADPFNWTQFVGGGLLASSASTDLTFGFYNPPNYFYLDDVTVESPAPIPEPASVLLIGFGLMACAALRRRR